jgi:predicted HAD superfamily Cof-like phosphohydrolase/predicted RNase H-like HicB family nuclease
MTTGIVLPGWTCNGCGGEATLQLAIEVNRKEDGRWIAEVPALPDVMAYGFTKDEAISVVKDRAKQVLNDCSEPYRFKVSAQYYPDLASGPLDPAKIVLEANEDLRIPASLAASNPDTWHISNTGGHEIKIAGELTVIPPGYMADVLLGKDGEIESVKNVRAATLRAQVSEFHKVFGIPTLETPTVPSAERVKLRLRLILEEAFELLEASYPDSFMVGVFKAGVMDLIGDRNPSVNLPEFVDALADIDYVVEGTRLEFGVDGGPIAAEVHRANMTKVGGPKDADGKQLKPPGWTPPNVLGELEKQGYNKLGGTKL